MLPNRLICIVAALLLLLPAGRLLAAPVDISADEISRTADGVIIAKGNVIIKRDNETLQADEVFYRTDQRILEARGHVVIESPQATIQAEDAVLQTGSKTGNLTRATIILPGGERLVAERVRRIDDQRFEAEELTYSSCPIDQESWRIAAERALLDQEDGSLTTHNGSFQIWEVPVFYTPWWQQPLRRKSGLLMPHIASGKRRGTEVAVPLYLATDPSWDMTLKPHWMSARGVMGDVEWRHISGLGHEQLHGSFINDSEVNKDRYHYNGEIHWNLPAGFAFDADGNYVSDRDYLADYATGENISARYLTSHATLAQGFGDNDFSGNWLLQTRYQQDLLLANNGSTLQILPRAESRMQWELNPNLQLHFDQQTTRFDRKSGVDGWRLDLHPYIELPWQLAGGGVSANLQLGSHHTRYWLQQTNVPNRLPTRSTAEASLELRSDFERISDSQTWRHTISPIIRYDYIDAPDQTTLPNFDSGFGRLSWNTLLSGNRFVGYDRIERSNRISMVVESRLQHKNDIGKSALNLLTMRGGVAYDLQRTSVDPALQASATRPFSNLLAGFDLNPLEGFHVSANGQYNPADRYWATGSASAGYHSSRDDYVNIAYRYTDARYARRNQLITASGNLSISNRWHVGGSWQYDTLLKLSQQASLELKYRHPCWLLGVEGFRTNRRTGTTNTANFGFRILLEFKGLGSVGS
ncbi:LPS assembly outer membrane protein LptD (organic solvent tolerance protein OstA) [Mariprofundus ferrinatatus]|uniref:LPS-assembly protein LptD n=1 Tax=Mariprofundus ferrinatatus TaxID=1921087 RepID=A0A2K8L1G3_9PROT|nr:LPS assembly protein LptD [Mariprofundus ferrinatatus]ATX81155.1 LPS assembly outer membrane protein LptD (organic solvent tolerance protein OstA) [Mariprofundus ferrinatatus]